MNVKLIECPRDAMQGLPDFIPTADKVRYLNQLLRVGFHTLDFGSFVSPKVIPQMRDTAEVLEQLNWKESTTRLLAIVANLRGAEQATSLPGITYLGFPLSISETFQQRNTRKSIAEALNTVHDIQELCIRTGRELVVYISMGFGNPYGDPYSADIVVQFTDILVSLGVRIISLADTIGAATPEQIADLFTAIIPSFPSAELGAHLHARPFEVVPKIQAAYRAGCRRFDGAIHGFGGCPMAQDDLVGNIPTEKVVEYLEKEGIPTGIAHAELQKARIMATEIFPKY
jgi:hydroxymethylglutaryl-CoA lyase